MTSFARTMAGIISTTGDVKSTVVGDIGLSVYSTLDSLPTSALTSGDQAFVSENNRIYVSNGSGWYNVALLNATPTLSISPSGAVTLATDGSTPTVITLTGTDSDNADANLIYTAESDGSFGGLATLSQDSSVFTITPLAEGSATTTSSTLTFKVSDGISFGSGTTEFSLTFGPDWSATPTERKIVASDAAAGDQFGTGVAISSDGNYVIVGAPLEDGTSTDMGAAYVYVRSGSTWTQQAKLVSSDLQETDYFGHSVSINSDGTYAIVGAYGEDTGASLAGAAYIFTRSGSTWTQQQKIQASDKQASDLFGVTVSISGDGNYAIAGAYVEDTGGSSAGSAYVFERSGSTWTQQQKIQASDAGFNKYFGYSVSLNSDGTYAAISSPRDNNDWTGSAYIFTRSGSTWTQQQKIQASDASSGWRLGYSIAISGDGAYVIVGSHYHDGVSFGLCAAFVFECSGSTWTQQSMLIGEDSDRTAGDMFGYSVQINSDGTFAVVGAPRDRDNDVTPISNAGAAYVFERSGSTWTQRVKIQSSEIQAEDEYGNVAISGDGKYAVVSANFEDGGAGDPLQNAGAAYIYES